MSLLELPVNVIDIIIMNLDIKDIILTIPLVCRKLREISNNQYLWSKIYERNIFDDHFQKIFTIHEMYDSYRVMLPPYNKKDVLIYLRCDKCHKYMTDTSGILYCRHGHQTCINCKKIYQTCATCYQRAHKLDECHKCHKTIVDHRSTGFVSCCQGVICAQCTITHTPQEYRMVVDSIKKKSLICAKHCTICQLCGSWSTKSVLTVCCKKYVCDMCHTQCDGCDKPHCVKHCQYNKCQKSGCCHVSNNRKFSINVCNYNGTICSSCYEPIISEVTCHPNMATNQKFCSKCYHTRTAICLQCEEITPLDHMHSCDCCRKVLCESHLTHIQRYKKYVCSQCIASIQSTCDKCLDLYHFIDLVSSGGTKFCRKCVRGT